MTTIGIFLSSEERPASELVAGARAAEQAGFQKAWISDHFHPWTDAQGESTFVWSVLGAIAQVTDELTVHTAVTAPTIRIHPAIIAQAAATIGTMMPGRFGLGVGSGEALNEHVLGDRWPSFDTRIAMLEESVEVIRELWQGGFVTRHGEHYDVEHARIYSLPDELPPIHVSAFGPKAAEAAARCGDGLMTVGPEKDVLERYRAAGGTGTSHTGLKVCWGPDEAEQVKIAHETWPNDVLPGELAQVLSSPRHFEQAAELVTEEMIAEAIPCGPDVEKIADAIQEHVDAGFDEVYVSQIGPRHEEFIEMLGREILPRFS